MAWRELRNSELSGWNERLLADPSACLRQFPLFNEGLRGTGALWVTVPGRFAPLIAAGRRWTTTPRYVVRETRDGTIFAAIVSIGFPGFRVGSIVDGPALMGQTTIDPDALEGLIRWARRRGYVTLRVTHPNEQYLQAIAACAESDRVDAVPFYPRASSELYVDLKADETALQAGFQAVARRNIRQARDAGYVITIDQDPAALERAWPAFEGRSAEKGISYRNREAYQRMMRQALPHEAAHLFTAWQGSTPIAAILNLRDRSTAHYFLGTINTGALGENPSPAALLHWTAMQHARDRGAAFYNLGTRSGAVYTFKAKFRPTEREYPEPVALIVNRFLYRSLWRPLLPRLTRFAVS